MPTDSQQTASEAYIKRRYERWRTMAVPFDYKRSKSERIAEILKDTGGLPKTALELGVGPGGIAGPLSRLGVHLIGIDLSIDALMRAKEYCRDDDVALLRGSGFTLPFADGTFPVIYASQVLHLFDDKGRLALMREAQRVLQPQGRFVFDMKNVIAHALRYLGSTPERKRRNFPRLADVGALLHQAGFVGIEMKPGLLPGLARAQVPNLSLLRLVAHTVFFVARRP
jgi:ubiquinone/menaquinone biosynthesis C-methylase UbiE